MFEWIVPEESARASAGPACAGGSGGPGGTEVRFAAEHADGELHLFLDLRADAGETAPPSLPVEASEPGATLTLVEPPGTGVFRYRLTVPAASPPPGGALADDERTFLVGGGPVPPCRVVLRRTAWPIHTALLGSRQKGPVLRPQTRAALLWYGWNRYQGLVGLKRFTSGLTGSDVLVFQPMLRRPADAPDAADGVQTWGSFLLVKTGSLAKVQKEWRGFRDYLADRAHPFMGRCEDYLVVQPAGPPGEEVQASIIGSFLGGNLLQVESLRSLVRGSGDVGRCLQVLDKLCALLAPWYAGHELAPLSRWDRVFRPGGSRGILLFGKYDFARKESDQDTGTRGRDEYAGPLSWDVAFIEGKHLSDHLLGSAADERQRRPERPGLLHRLRDRVRVRFSLTHGDLHPENILADPDNVWLLDFGETGADAPTLYDFTKLEVFLRLWCLDLSPAAKDLDQGVAKFEKGLLDVLLGTAGALEAVDELAAMMGARPNVLRKVAACITWLRRRATPYTLGSPDRQDYLAVLYLTALQTLQYAGKERERLPNYRMLVTLACLVEDVLSRLMDLDECPRGRESLDYRHLVTPEWLAAPGAPARVAYLMRRRDGRKALPFLAATRGVLQNAYHHLDVFDHTLLVMANLEELLRDPVGALLDPAAYERRVARGLRQQGLRLPATRSRPMETDPPSLDGLDAYLDAIRALLDERLDGESRLLLKWLSLLHDVGKPATRCVLTVRSGVKKVQFRGHEAYSAFLTQRHLEHWFPNEAVRARLMRLIEHHHQHHHFMDTHLGPKALEELRQGLRENEDRKPLLDVYKRLEALPDLPLLLLHGFADVAACAGPESREGLGRVAEMNLVLLAVCTRFPAYHQVHQRARQIEGLVRGAMEGLGFTPVKDYRPLKKVLTAWVEERTPPADGNGSAAGPSEEAVREEARQAAARLGLTARR